MQTTPLRSADGSRIPDASLAGQRARSLKAGGILPVALGDADSRAEKRMLRHVRRVTGRWRRLACRLGYGAHVVRARAAADAEIPHAELERGRREFAQLVAGAGERVEPRRE